MLSPITMIPLHLNIIVIVLSKILEPRLAYLAKEIEKKIKTQEDVIYTQEDKFKAQDKTFRDKRRRPK